MYMTVTTLSFFTDRTCVFCCPVCKDAVLAVNESDGEIDAIIHCIATHLTSTTDKASSIKAKRATDTNDKPPSPRKPKPRMRKRCKSVESSSAETASPLVSATAKRSSAVRASDVIAAATSEQHTEDDVASVKSLETEAAKDDAGARSDTEADPDYNPDVIDESDESEAYYDHEQTADDDVDFNVQRRTENGIQLDLRYNYVCPQHSFKCVYLATYLRHIILAHFDFTRVNRPASNQTLHMAYRNGRYVCDSCRVRTELRLAFIEHVRCHALKLPYYCTNCRQRMATVLGHQGPGGGIASCSPSDIRVRDAPEVSAVMRRLGPGAPPVSEQDVLKLRRAYTKGATGACV